nr:hypothetical protein [Tanacetum cinerariifolium]
MRFEEKIYTTATSQKSICKNELSTSIIEQGIDVMFMMVTMETRSQNPMPDAMQANNGLNPLDPGMETKGLFGMAE